MDGTILNKKYDLVKRIEALEEGGGGGGYVLPVASDTTLGGVKVGAGLSINGETGVLSADGQTVDYSTTEQNTGQKWIDGSTIYARTEMHEVPSDVAAGITRFNDTSFAANINVIKAEIVLELNNGSLTPGVYAPWYAQGTILYAGLDATGLGVYFGGNLYAGYKVYVTLYYTKTEVTKKRSNKKS